MKAENHIASFLVYSAFVYPVTNYLVSPQRTYSRTKGIIAAVAFLALVAVIQLQSDESSAEDSNMYAVLGVDRATSLAAIRKAFKRLSLEFHPDKNRAEGAADVFQRIKLAYDILGNPEARSVYDRFGIEGVKTLAHSVVDSKYVMTRLLMRYGTSVVFTFLTNMSESSTAGLSYAGLAALLLLEILFAFGRIQMPSGVLLQYTSCDVITCLHKVFPTFMNGLRCIISSFDQPKEPVVQLMEAIKGRSSMLARRLSTACKGVVRDINAMAYKTNSSSSGDSNTPDSPHFASSIASALSRTEADVEQSQASQAEVAKMQEALLRLRTQPDVKPRGVAERYRWIGHIAMYLTAWCLYHRYVTADVTASNNT